MLLKECNTVGPYVNGSNFALPVQLLFFYFYIVWFRPPLSLFCPFLPLFCHHFSASTLPIYFHLQLTTPSNPGILSKFNSSSFSLPTSIYQLHRNLQLGFLLFSLLLPTLNTGWWHCTTRRRNIREGVEKVIRERNVEGLGESDIFLSSKLLLKIKYRQVLAFSCG